MFKKLCMRKGVIVKNKHRQYMRIEHVKDKQLYCSILSREDTPNVVYSKNDVVVVSCRTLKLPVQLLKKMLEGRTNKVVHDETPMWLHIYIQPTELVKLHDNDNNIEILVKVKNVIRSNSRLMYKVSPIISIELGEIVWKKVL